MRVGEIWRLKKHNERELKDSAERAGVLAGFVRVEIVDIKNDLVVIIDADDMSDIPSVSWKRGPFVKAHEKERS